MATAHRENNMIKWVGVRPGHNGTQVIIDINTLINADLYTVPADSLLMIFGWSWGVSHNLAAESTIEIKTAGAAHYCWLGLSTSQVGEPGISNNNALFVPIELPEGYVISIITARQCYGHIHGVLIDA